MFEELNRASCINDSDLVQGYIVNEEKMNDQSQWIQNFTDDYWFDLANDVRARARNLPSWMEDEYLRIEEKRTERGIEKNAPARGSEYRSD
jgi:hypothetical protein